MDKILFVELGTGYDIHGQDVTKAAVKACYDAMGHNSIAAFSTGAIPNITDPSQLKLKVRLGVPRAIQGQLHMEKIKSAFPYGQVVDVEVVDGGLVASNGGVIMEKLRDKTDEVYGVNAAVYIGI